MKWNKEKWVVHFAGVFIARCCIFGYCPFGTAFFIAANVSGMSSTLLWLIMAAGTYSALGVVGAVKYSLVMVVATVLTKLLSYKNKQAGVITAAAVGGIVTTVISAADFLWEPDLWYQTMTSLLQGIVVFAACVIFQKGLGYLNKKSETMSHEEAVGLSFILMAALLGIPNIINQYVALLEAACFLVILYMGYRYGIKESGLLGAICGCVLAFRYEQTILLGIVVILGMGTSLLRGLGKSGVVISFVGTVGLLNYLYPGVLLERQVLFSMALAIFLFLIAPKSIMRPILTAYEDQSDTNLLEGAIWAATKNQLREFAEAFHGLQRTLELVPVGMELSGVMKTDQVLEKITNTVCDECSKYNFCWSQNAGTTYQAVSGLFEAMELEQGTNLIERTSSFGENCIQMDQFILAANYNYEISRLEQIWNNRILEGREAIAAQLGEVAEILNNVTTGLYQESELEPQIENAIITAMKAINIKVMKATALMDNQNHQDIYLTAKSTKGRMPTTREAAKVLTKVLGKSMKVRDGNKMIVGKQNEVIAFAEEENFYYLQGVARIAKQNEYISGDNFSFLPLLGGQLVMMLADGMGSGETANKESENLIEMLEKMLLAGFSSKSAIQLLNAVLAGPIDRPMFSTLDFAVIDLYEGRAQMVKIGASTTFIRRENTVEVISSTTLPMGILPNMEYETVQKELNDGDIIFMVSDGIMEAVSHENKEDYIKDLILSMTINNPKEMADHILDRVQAESLDENKDDMTVLALGLWKR